ncbi:TRC40/GET3/ArsA family transport-energizing ATPase [Desulfuribacillus alkaliarsenatis]|uniref:AAA+ ATPase domain-containing protein n=1 Tax=Desulfuribacillus alkaliarsenatis TaxID=766136 RepID=A0A1E5G0V8_9FIRM|nr:TRC40/GET3/ArsA family transport-energizing ATPase [Desulfuribacillus alkaliarsenatis]OEF96464.1 hypothetical protein BHF68_07335 [Desulfuribacillus alkaliarsenatis]
MEAQQKHNTSFYFFSGKGGVGKTSTASATAVHFANQGKKTLLVTTDPASNVADVFMQPIGHKITKIEMLDNLYGMEIDPVQATEEYRNRTLEPMRKILPAQILDVVEEELNSPCTEEIASFDRFIDFMDSDDFDVVIFDTAPTGHTLRMLELPIDWAKHIESAEQGSGQTCMGPVQLLKGAREKYEKAIVLMRNQEITTFVFVAHPEATPINEMKRSTEELKHIGIIPKQLIINGILPEEVEVSQFFSKRRQMQQKYLHNIEAELAIEIKKVPLLNIEIRGKEALIRLGKILYETEYVDQMFVETKTQTESKEKFVKRENPDASSIVLPASGEKQRVVLFAGKGGVGKTSVACATAVWSAMKGKKTLLVTTDPASHLSNVFEQEIEEQITDVRNMDNLHATRINPKKALAAYREEILSDAKGKYSEDMVAMLQEQLDSPCTEEMASFHKFIQYMVEYEDKYEVIVFDTAPTGHTLRLLELPINWNKKIDTKGEQRLAPTDAIIRDKFEVALTKMRDDNKTSMSFVVYPESTPILEAKRASEELATVEIQTAMVVANLVLPIEHCTTPYLLSRWEMQQSNLQEMETAFKQAKVLQLEVFDQEIVGLDILKQSAFKLYG